MMSDWVRSSRISMCLQVNTQMDNTVTVLRNSWNNTTHTQQLVSRTLQSHIVFTWFTWLMLLCNVTHETELAGTLSCADFVIITSAQWLTTFNNKNATRQSTKYLFSIGTTACRGLWPVEQNPSIFSYLSPTLSMFSLLALEDLFRPPLSISKAYSYN
jgi:hypothetical protein